MKEKWFIEDISPWDMSAESVCLHLSNYKLLSHEEIEKKYGKKISELRWVELEDAEVKAGGASGLLIVDGEKFKLTYAWGGLNSKEDYHIRMNYTVKVEGEDCEKFFRSLGTRIAEVEGVTPCRGSQLNAVTPEDPIFSPFLYTVRPYKERRKKTMWRSIWTPILPKGLIV